MEEWKKGSGITEDGNESENEFVHNCGVDVTGDIAARSGGGRDKLGESVLIVQLDAHLDIHHFRDCTAELSHGNFLLHVEGRLPPLVNAGHRDQLLTAVASPLGKASVHRHPTVGRT